MSRFPETLLSIALTTTLSGVLLTAASAQTTDTDAPATAAPAADTQAAAAQSADAPADAPADPQPAEAAAPGASAGSDAAMQAEAAGEEPAATPDTATDVAAETADAAPDAPAGSGTATAWPGAGKTFQLGREALPEEIAAWDLDVRPDGQGLPDGEGDVATGDELFSDYCASCHGDFAEGVDNWPKLAGGMNTLDHEDPLKTVGSFWPYLSTAWDYIHRSMPFGAAQTLDADQTYAMVAYILYSNDLVDDDFVLNKDTFLTVEMPNADGFIVDDRDDVELAAFSQEPCMENCKDSVEITKRALILDVTPGGPEDAGGDDTNAPRMD